YYGMPFSVRIIDEKNFQLSLGSEDDPDRFDKTLKFSEQVVDPRFTFMITGVEDLIKQNKNIKDIEYEFRVNNHDALVRKYQRRLKIEKVEEASVFEVSIEDEVPQKAVDFVNAITDLYIENSVAVAKGINAKTLEFIEDQLAEVAGELNSVESNLEAYQKEKSTLNLGEEQSAYLQRVIEFESEKARLSIQLQSIDALYKSLAGGTMTQISPTLLSDNTDPSLVSSFNELASLQQRRTNLLFSNTPSSPVVQKIDAEINTAKQNIISMVMSQRKSLVEKINGLSAQIGQYRGSIRQMPTTMRGLVDISRKVAINEKIYLFLLESRAKTIIAKAAIVADKYILEEARPTGLARPIKQQVIFTGMGAAVALSFLLIFLKGIYYNNIQTKDDLIELTKLPIIGIVGKSKEAKDDYQVVNKNPQSLTSEAFRVIRTNLTYFKTKHESKTVLFTSSAASEGKTFCAINTATILAKARKKVVLIDLDLHKPRQANAFGIKNDVGITSYLVGKASIDDILKDSGIENLKLILTGPRTPNASELVLDSMLEDLITSLREEYEYIILDTPPVGLLSDSLVLMKYSDINIYVLKANYSKKDFVDIAHQIVEKNEIKNMCFLLNAVNTKNIPAGYGGGYYK
ncbi:MAG: polysaccharide biosynthesis tyrosine autokinase, partial [Bacteroidia bacterium]|nr:polysaccharide biosynthesis tyrosine autokinase [Bacteroidia bacterium]